MPEGSSWADNVISPVAFTAPIISIRRPETIDLQVEGTRTRVEMAADDECIARLLEELIASGVRMHSFAEKDPSLEDVFMLVTKGLVA